MPTKARRRSASGPAAASANSLVLMPPPPPPWRGRPTAAPSRVPPGARDGTFPALHQIFGVVALPGGDPRLRPHDADHKRALAQEREVLLLALRRLRQQAHG